MAYSSDITAVKKNNYHVFIGSDILPGCLAEPQMTEEKGDEIALNDGTKPVIAKNSSINVVLANVTAANLTQLRALVNTKATITFSTNATYAASLASGDWRLTDVVIFPALAVKGNAVSQITISGTVETAPSTHAITTL